MQLNLVRSINLILDTLAHELAAHPPGRPRTGSPPRSPPDSPDSATGPSLAAGPPVVLTETHALLRLRLAPLRQVEHELRRLLGAASSEAGAFEAAGPGHGRRSAERDLCLRSNRTWKDALGARRASVGGAGAGGRAVSPGPGERDDATEVIAGCREDIRALWADAGVQELLARQRIRLADSAGL